MLPVNLSEEDIVKYKNNPILESISEFITKHIDESEIRTIAIREFTQGSKIPFTISLFTDSGQLIYCKQRLNEDLSNWESVCSKLCEGYNKLLETSKLTYKFKAPNGTVAEFSKVYGTHIFTDEECERLAKGDRIFFVTSTKDNEDYKYVAVGKLEQADFDNFDDEKLSELIGTRRYGFIRDMSYRGLRAYFKKGQLFSRDELLNLLNGNTIEHTYVDDYGNEKKVKLRYDHNVDELEKVNDYLYLDFTKYCTKMYGRCFIDGKLATFSEKNLKEFISAFKKKNNCEIEYDTQYIDGEYYYIVTSVKEK